MADMKNPALIAGDAHPELAREIAQGAGAQTIPAAITAFADGETRIHIEGDVRGTDLYIA